MAELDYAFVAEFAKVEKSGTLTAIGASYLEVRPGHVWYILTAWTRSIDGAHMHGRR